MEDAEVSLRICFGLRVVLSLKTVALSSHVALLKVQKSSICTQRYLP